MGMMMRRFQVIVAVLLVLCVVGISGIASAQSILHENHHSHHQAATHGSAFCSWMCAAGQAYDTAVVPLTHTTEELATIPPVSSQSVPLITVSVRSPRAPPVSSL